MSSASRNAANPYIHWVHCNRCYETFIKKERTFVLLACKHVICQPCLVEIVQVINGPRIYKCNVCYKVTRGVEINTSMPTNLKNLFHPEPYLDGLNSFQIVKFQSVHRRRYLQHLDRQANRIKEMEKAEETYKEIAKNTFREWRQARIDRKRAEKRVLSILQQKKDGASNSSSFSTSPSLMSAKGRSSHGQMKDVITSFQQMSYRDSNSDCKSHGMTTANSSTSFSLKSRKRRSIDEQMKDGITSFSELDPKKSFFL